jgi:20S proteasome alpha/beta subunit
VTLIVSIKSAFGLVVAADGMAYYGHGDADVPHAAKKVRTVRSTNWLFSFSGQGTAETVFQSIQAEIECGRLTFDADIRIAVSDYFGTFDYQMGGNFSTSLLLAGFDGEGNARVYAHDTKNRTTDLLGDVFALGAQHSTAIWIVNTFLQETGSLDDVAFLAYFAIAQVADQDIKVGNPGRYFIDVCTLANGNAPKFAEVPELQKYAERSQEFRARVQRAFQAEATGSPIPLRS